MTNGDADKSMSREEGGTAFKFSKEGESQSQFPLPLTFPHLLLM